MKEKQQENICHGQGLFYKALRIEKEMHSFGGDNDLHSQFFDMVLITSLAIALVFHMISRNISMISAGALFTDQCHIRLLFLNFIINETPIQFIQAKDTDSCEQQSVRLLLLSENHGELSKYFIFFFSLGSVLIAVCLGSDIYFACAFNSELTHMGI